MQHIFVPMRGRKTLYQDLFIDKPTPSGDGKRLYLDRRDEALAHRYYFYANIVGYSYEACLLRLEEEFYLSSRAIIQRLDQNMDVLKSLIKTAPKLSEIKQKYPYYTWAV